MRVIVCITGASGIIYALRMIYWLNTLGHEVITVVSREAIDVSSSECLDEHELMRYLRSRCSVIYMEDELTAPISSGSYHVDAVIVIPCSLKTLSDIANSRQSNLITRSVSNALRLRRKVVLVIRETPLSTIDLINALKASIAGAIVMPASPAFYIGPKEVIDLIDYVVGRVLDVLGIKDHGAYKAWDGTPTTQGRSLCVRYASP